MISKVNIACSSLTSHFLPQSASSMSSLDSFFSFDLQPQILMPFSRHDHPLSTQTIPTNSVCHSQLIYGFIQAQHQHQICRSFSVFELYFTHAHLVLAVTAASHPPPALTLSPRYANSLTVSTSSHNFTSCSMVSPIFPASIISWILCGHPFHSGTSTMDPLTTLYEQNRISLCSQAAYPTWVHLSCRQLVLDAICLLVCFVGMS